MSIKKFVTIKLCTTLVLCSATWATTRAVNPDYEVIQIFNLPNQPSQIGLVRKSDSQRISTKVGATMDGFKIIAVQEIGEEIFVKAEKEKAKHLFALRRPESAPFKEGPLLTSYENEEIDQHGRLTSDGKRTVINNLRQIHSSGAQHLLEAGKTSVKFDDIDKDRFPELKRIRSIAGESYKNLIIKGSGDLILTVETLFGEKVSVP